jgi:two-component system KDP operon response regulator KdpE
LARARAVLRRTELLPDPEDQFIYNDGYLLIDLRKHRVQVNNQPAQLSSTEFRLLTYLLQNAGQVLTYQNILDKVWGWEYQDSVDYVHVYISHLRRKIEADPRNPKYLLTERGTGYRFERKKK